MMLGANNKYRRIQGKLLELDDAIKNECDEDLYKLMRQKIIEPMNSFLFQLHLAFENGRGEGQRSVERKQARKKVVRKQQKQIPQFPTVSNATIPNNQVQ